METAETMGARLREVRKRWGLTQRELATRTGLGLATIRRIEQGQMEPRMATTRRLAGVLKVEEAWLAFGTWPMVLLGNMTVEEQFKGQSGPGMEGLPGFVVFGWPGEAGRWYRDDNGELQVSRSSEGEG